MYLSRVLLKVHDCYEQHQSVWSLFPAVPSRRRDHLFRVEKSSSCDVEILLQSSTAPSTSDTAVVIAKKEFNPSLSQGGFYKFKTVCYPTKRLSRSKRIIELDSLDEQVEWLQKKLCGANVTVTSMDNFLVRNSKSFTSRYVCFEGTLQVINTESVERALVLGLGRKKHAGAGLLSLVKVQ